MSIKVMSRVWQQSKQRGSSLVVMLAIADFADDMGVAFPSVNTLARKARISESNVHAILKSLQEAKELIIERNAGSRRANLYTVQSLEGAANCTVQSLEGAASCTVQSLEGAALSTQRVQPAVPQRVQPAAPEPSLEPSLEPSIHILETKTRSKEIEAQEVWPDWYATLYAIPGFKVDLEHAEKWLSGKGYSVDLAERTAYALKGKWPGPTKSPYRDAWATFQHWCANEINRGKENHGKHQESIGATQESLAALAKYS